MGILLAIVSRRGDKGLTIGRRFLSELYELEPMLLLLLLLYSSILIVSRVSNMDPAPRFWRKTAKPACSGPVPTLLGTGELRLCSPWMSSTLRCVYETLL